MPPLSQEDRIRQIRAEAAAEAAENVRNASAARMLSSVALVDDSMAGRRNLPTQPKRNLSVLEEEAERVARNLARKQALFDGAVDNEPCFLCGVKKISHHELGCKRWRGKP